MISRLLCLFGHHDFDVRKIEGEWRFHCKGCGHSCSADAVALEGEWPT